VAPQQLFAHFGRIDTTRQEQNQEVIDKVGRFAGQRFAALSSLTFRAIRSMPWLSRRAV
jgi:hypothetical protein